MATNKAAKRLLPENTLVFATKSKVIELTPDAISCDVVGQKTFGLLTIPRMWTPPFFGISEELFKSFSSSSKGRKQLINHWSALITKAASKAGIKSSDAILVRSSGCDEGMNRRGKFHSTHGEMGTVGLALTECLNKLAGDIELKSERIPLVIQKRCHPEKAMGHLSNERRCYEERRDWMGESNSKGSDRSHYFQINLRRWRENIPQKPPEILSCLISTRISELLRFPATWAYQKGARVHFEWVWDGHTVYLVQADEESSTEGHDPVKEHAERVYIAPSFSPQCLRAVNADDGKRFGKIANVFTYLSLKLPIAPLYILDDAQTFSQIASGNIPINLKADITELVKGSLVIRTDIATNDLAAKQLLPRTHELRNASAAFDWLIKQSQTLVKLDCQGAFIFHNFIPAESAAFAYAAPNEPLVQIESLWGLPEGLYYNSHDKYLVDTFKKDIDSLSAGSILKFKVREKKNFKRFFVSTTPSGKWETLALAAPYDWKGCLSDSDCKQIAYESRRIAKAENKPVSIMWFVGVPPTTAKSPAIPWYHEGFDIAKSRTSVATRTKTPFDNCYIIQSAKDVEDLKNGMQASRPGDRIRVQPLEESLLRDKSTLKRIGELAKSKGAVIVLEGAVLSHAYYQLLDTGAIVEVVHPFIGFEERHEFNKLVRDKIPDIIRERGEKVTTAQLNSEAVVMALREKLVEEAYELLDAKDFQSVLAELADVREVVDTLVQKLKISEEDVKSEQIKKREERGGFQDGIVLIKTESVPPTTKTLPDQESHLEGLQPGASPNTKILDDAEFRARSEVIDRRTDRRVAPGQIEIKANVSIPATRRSVWAVETAEERIEDGSGKVISGSMKGVRNGSQWNFDVSVWIDETQMELILDSSPKMKASSSRQKQKP